MTMTKTAEETAQEIEKIARASLQKAYDKFPMGCDEDQMKEFLSTEPYPEVSYAILTIEDYQSVIKKYV